MRLVFNQHLPVIGCLFLWWVNIVCAADLDLEVGIGATYDSNVFRSYTTPEKDACFTLSPKLTLTMPFNKVYFSSDSRIALEQYLNQADASLQEFGLSGLGRFDASARTSFGLQESLIISGRLKSVEQLTDVVSRREFRDNRLSSSITHNLKKDGLAASLQYTNNIRDYRHSENAGWVANSGLLQIDYSLGYKTSTQLSFGLTRKTYKSEVSYTSFPVAASLKRKLSNKLGASFSLGWENRRYNEILQFFNWDEPNVSFTVTGSFTPKTASSLELHRRVYDSDITPGYTFVSKGGILALYLNLSDSARLALQGLYSRNNYIKLKWASDVYEGRGEIRYRLMRWGALALGYGYENWSTNFLDVLGYDYNKHVVDLSYLIIFD